MRMRLERGRGRSCYGAPKLVAEFAVTVGTMRSTGVRAFAIRDGEGIKILSNIYTVLGAGATRVALVECI